MAETTTISNLPQITIDELTNDTLVPVENVDGTKAANLAQLRKKLNSLYVEMVDADLNELKQDGIYECWGTTINAPTSEVAAWIIQTAEHGGVVVQNAFGLGTTSYSYVYRRRWNGVSWTAWENKIQTLETVKANVDLSNLSAAGQAKFDAKANTDFSNVTRNIDYVIFSGIKNDVEIIEWKSGKIEFFSYVKNVATTESGGTLVHLPYPRDNSKSFCCLSGGIPSTSDNGITSFYCAFADDSNIKVVRDYYGTSSVTSCYTFAWYYRQK